jgi:hypothetical protein
MKGTAPKKKIPLHGRPSADRAIASYDRMQAVGHVSVGVTERYLRALDLLNTEAQR